MESKFLKIFFTLLFASVAFIGAAQRKEFSWEKSQKNSTANTLAGWDASGAAANSSTDNLSAIIGPGTITANTRLDVRGIGSGNILRLATSGNAEVIKVTDAGATTIIGLAKTNLTASTEYIDLSINLERSVQFTTGALALQRAVRIQAPTYAFVAASTITDAYTTYIDPPVAGTNATITRSWTLGITGNIQVRSGGIIRFEKSNNVGGSVNADIGFGLNGANGGNGLAFRNNQGAGFSFQNLGTEVIYYNTSAIFGVGTNFTVDGVNGNTVLDGNGNFTLTNGNFNKTGASTLSITSAVSQNIQLNPGSGGSVSVNSSLVLQDGNQGLIRTGANEIGILSNGLVRMTFLATGEVTSGSLHQQVAGTIGFNQLSLTPTYNTTGTYAGTARGVYYNPTLTSTVGLTHIAFENTSGQLRFGGVTQDDTKTQILAKDATTNQMFWRASSTLGITNTAVANELMKSNGTNAVPSGLFSTTAGDLVLGTGLASGLRTITTDGTLASVPLLITVKGSAGITIRSGDNGIAFESGGVFATSSEFNRAVYTGSSFVNTPVHFSVFNLTGGAPAVGIGSGIQLISKTAAGNSEIGALIEAVTTDLTGLSEDFDIVFKTMNAGAAALERFRFDTQNNFLTLTRGSRIQIGSVLLSGNRSISAVSSSADSQLELITTGGVTMTSNHSSTNNVFSQLILTRETTGVSALGIGTGIEFRVETSAGNTEIGGLMDVVTTNVGAGTEAFDFVLKTMSAGAAATERVRFTSDGRIYGTALHNNAGAITGTANQYIASGTYTPTLTGVANVASTIAFKCQFIRVGNSVTVSGRLAVAGTASATHTQVGISLPIASNFATDRDAAGVAHTSESGVIRGGAIMADITNDRAELVYNTESISSRSFYFTFTYEIL